MKYLIALLLLLVPVIAQARTDLVRWTHSDPASVAGYRIYYGNSPGVYVNMIDVPAPVPVDGIFRYTFNVPDQDTIYVVITAYNSAGLESVHSNEGVRVPMGKPGTPYILP